MSLNVPLTTNLTMMMQELPKKILNRFIEISRIQIF